MPNVKNIIGMKFGQLTVISRAENSKNNKSRWFCVCDCGKTKSKPVTYSDLVHGKVKSCGCIYKDQNKLNAAKHGEYHTRLWKIWRGMKTRCMKCSPDSKDYYFRGIKVCTEWSEYINFRDWALSNGYSDDLSIDRIDNDKGYSPDNCRWATQSEQQNNKRNNFVISVNGITHTLTEWSRITGIGKYTIRNRVVSGWKEDELFIKPNSKRRNKK